MGSKGSTAMLTVTSKADLTILQVVITIFVRFN
jgi:hypothetical protein